MAGRSRLRCPVCSAILGTWTNRGLEVEPSVWVIEIDADGVVVFVCRGCDQRLRITRGVAFVRVKNASLLS